MQKENALEKFKTGWHKLVEQVFEVEKQLPFCSGVASIERENGMLKGAAANLGPIALISIFLGAPS